MLYRPLLAMFMLLFGIGTKGEEESPANSEQKLLHVFMPERLQLRFGDPIFLPIAIANLSNQSLDGTTMFHGVPDIRFNLSAGETNVICNYDSSFGSGSSRKFAPQTVESFVILLNPWSPAFTAAASNANQFVIKADFGPIRYSIAKETNSPNKDVYSPKELMCVIELSGSAFNDGVNEAIITLARLEDSTGGTIVLEIPATSLGNLAFELYVTPFSWFLKKRGIIADDYLGSTKAVDSSVTDFARTAVQKDSKLSRLFEFDECLKDVKASVGGNKVAWDNAIPRVSRLIDRSSALESQYYVSQIAQLWGLRQLPANEHREVQTSLLNAFPIYAPFFSGERWYTTVSSMSININR